MLKKFHRAKVSFKNKEEINKQILKEFITSLPAVQLGYIQRMESTGNGTIEGKCKINCILLKFVLEIIDCQNKK